MCYFIQEVNEEPPPKYEPNKEQVNMKTSSGSKKSHQYTHEYVYHHEITKDFFPNNNFLQSHISSPQVWYEVPPTSNRLGKEQGKS